MSQQDSLFQEPGAAGPAATTTNDSATPFSGGPGRGDDLAAQLKVAQRSVSNLLILLLVVSGTLSVYLLQQVRYERADLAGMKVQEEQLQQARQVIANYNQQTVPAVNTFLKQLSDYARSHPDVVPVLLKYGLGASSAPQEGAPTGPER